MGLVEPEAPLVQSKALITNEFRTPDFHTRIGASDAPRRGAYKHTGNHFHDIINNSVEDTTEFHLPGHNYLGPGTHVLDRIRSRVKPVDSDDYNAFLHDIDYATGVNPDYADLKAIGRNVLGGGVHGIAMSAGLASRMVGSSLAGRPGNVFEFADKGKQYTKDEIEEMQFAALDPYYIPDKSLSPFGN